MDIFSIFFNMKVYCVFSLESFRFKCIHTIYNFYKKKKKITPEYSKSAVKGFFLGTQK